jgi:flavin reductase (DIM6/NTAB) family NADH-FMN oxidoreductase RutF
MIIDPETLDANAAYKLLVGSVIPRPIAWVSTLAADGVGNLSAFSFFTVVGRKPPKVSLTLLTKSDGVTLQDTFINIRDTAEFVVHVATLPQIAALHRSAFEFEPDEDEFDLVGLDKVPSEVVKPPRIMDAPIAFECVLDRVASSADGQTNVVWGRIVRFHIRDELYLPGGRIDTAALHTVGRVAGEYTLVTNAFMPPLDPDALAGQLGRRAQRLDMRSHDSSIDTGARSPSGPEKD